MYNVYRGDVYGRELYLENKFLGMAQILESYHRRFIGGQYQSRDDYKAEIFPRLISAIPPGIEPNYRASLEAKLNYMYQFSLRKRLADLIQLAPQGVITTLFGDDPNGVKQFIEKVVHTRNYLVHYAEGLERQAAHGVQLHWLYNNLKILCEIMFFREMGFEPSEIDSLLTESREYRFELERGRKAIS